MPAYSGLHQWYQTRNQSVWENERQSKLTYRSLARNHSDKKGNSRVYIHQWFFRGKAWWVRKIHCYHGSLYQWKEETHIGQEV